MPYNELVSAKDLARLQLVNTVLAGESEINPFAKLTESTLSAFESVGTTLQNIFEKTKTVFNKKEPKLELGFSPTAVQECLREVRYIDMREMLAYKPAGLKCGWKPYLDELVLCTELLSNIEEEFFRPYREFLSNLLEGKGKQSISGLNLPVQKHANRRLRCLERISKEFNAVDPKKDASDSLESTWGEVVSNNGEWEGVCKLLKKVIDVLNDMDRPQMLKDADGTEALLRAIMKTNFSEYNTKALNDVAVGGTEYVSMLEFYSVTYYRVLTILGSIKLTSDHIRVVFAR